MVAVAPKKCGVFPDRYVAGALRTEDAHRMKTFTLNRPAGAHVGHRLSGPRLQTVFAIAILAVAAFIVARSLG